MYTYIDVCFWIRNSHGSDFTPFTLSAAAWSAMPVDVEGESGEVNDHSTRSVMVCAMPIPEQSFPLHDWWSSKILVTEVWLEPVWRGFTSG